MKKSILLVFLTFIVLSLNQSCCKDCKNPDPIPGPQGVKPVQPIEEPPVVNDTQNYSTGLNYLSQVSYKALPSYLTNYNENLPLNKDLSNYFPTPGNQGSQGSCVGWATAYLKTYQESSERILDPNNIFFSPSFIYNQIKISDCIQGSIVEDAFKVIQEQGILLNRDFPYNYYNCTTQPTSNQVTNANKYKISRFAKVDEQNIHEIKSNLEVGNPILIALDVNQAFKNYSGGVFNNSANCQNCGHAVVVVGYDDTKNAFKLINSWGTGWGENGFMWINYNAFKGIVKEAYVADDLIESNTTSTYSLLTGNFNDKNKSSIIALGFNNKIGLRVQEFENYGNTYECNLNLSNNRMLANGTGGEYEKLTGDFNADSFSDIALVHRSSKYGLVIYTAFGKGNGEYEPLKHHHQSTNFGGEYSFKTGDFDGDNADDILIVHQSKTYGLVSFVAISSKNGAYEDIVNTTNSTNFGGEYELITGNFNGDSFDDIAMVHRSKTYGLVIYTAYGLGQGKFSSLYHHQQITDFNGNYKIVTGHFNNDNYEDVGLVYVDQTYGLVFFKVNGTSTNGNFENLIGTNRPSSNLRNSYEIHVNDFDGNGIDDLGIFTLNPTQGADINIAFLSNTGDVNNITNCDILFD